jgi:GNAT superfamily N-acetyltransferase
MKSIIKKILGFAFSNYEVFQIFRQGKQQCCSLNEDDDFEYLELNEDLFKQYDSPFLDKNKFYSGDEANGFACVYKKQIVGICFFWSGQRYLQRDFISLEKNEAKLVQIETLESMRGKGIAPKLIKFSSGQMFDKNFKVIYARIWHSNVPSIKSFTKAGWDYQCTVISVKFKFGSQLKFRWPF